MKSCETSIQYTDFVSVKRLSNVATYCVLDLLYLSNEPHNFKVESIEKMVKVYSINNVKLLVFA